MKSQLGLKTIPAKEQKPKQIMEQFIERVLDEIQDSEIYTESSPRK